MKTREPASTQTRRRH